MIFQICKCGYCTDVVFPTLWQLPNICWYEIPKNGSATVKMNVQHKQIHKPTGNILVVVRDPIVRAWSTFMHYMMPGANKYTRMQDWFAHTFNIQLDNYDINSKVQIFFDHFRAYNTHIRVHHMYPQTYFIDRQYESQFRVIDISKLTAELGVPVTNNTEYLDKQQPQFTKTQQTILEDIYKEDYEFIAKI